MTEQKVFKFCKWSFLKASLLGAFVALSLAGCDSQTAFTQGAVTEYFLQDYNPEYLDVLWVMDDRTSVAFRSDMRTNLINQSSAFFNRLNSKATADYRMGIVSADVDYSVPGSLKPKDSPLVLTKDQGTLAQRVQNFANIIGLPVNLHTSAINKGFQSAQAALLSTFPPRPNVPLVLVFVSDSDDHSPAPTSDAVGYYAGQFLSMKNNQADLLRVYSINYEKTGARCATVGNADIDKSTFQDRYFKLATAVGGGKADICTSFAAGIDLSGVTLKTLPKRFKLDNAVTVDTLQVLVFDNTQTYNAPWTYDAATGEIVFTDAPPAGTTIQVVYRRP